MGVTSSIVSLRPALFVTFVEGNHWEKREMREVRGGPTSKVADTGIPTARSPPLLFFPSLCPPSNPRPLKTSRRPPHIMTQLSNPIAVAQTQGSALNPLESDCFSRVKWLRPPCHFLGHRHHCAGCLELLRLEPSHRPGWPTYSDTLTS